MAGLDAMRERRPDITVGFRSSPPRLSAEANLEHSIKRGYNFISVQQDVLRVE